MKLTWISKHPSSLIYITLWLVSSLLYINAYTEADVGKALARAFFYSQPLYLAFTAYWIYQYQARKDYSLVSTIAIGLFLYMVLIIITVGTGSFSRLFYELYLFAFNSQQL